VLSWRLLGRWRDEKSSLSEKSPVFAKHYNKINVSIEELSGKLLMVYGNKEVS